MKNLFKALANFQQEVPVIHKGTQGYGYSFADLTAIFKVINPLLKKHGLGFTQLVGDGAIKTIVFHVESGEQIETTTTIPQGVSLKGMNDFQVLGSAITYIRRYALSSALGLVTDSDPDANGVKEKPTQQSQPKQETKSEPKEDKPKVDKWMTEKQFEELKQKTKAEIKKYLGIYNGTTPYTDGHIYGMKKQYKEELEKLI